MNRSSAVAAAAAFALGIACATAGHAAEVTALVSNALKSTLEELAPAFEKTSEHKLKMTFGTTDPLKVRIEKGEAIDLTILGEGAIDDLVKQGKLAAATRVVVTRSGLGVAIRKGAPKPTLATAEDFKRTLLAAKSISYNEVGLTGNYLKVLFERLGITAEVKSRHKNGPGAELVGKGESEIGLTQASEVIPVPGVDLGGLLPAQIQNYTVFAAAVASDAKQAAGAKALLAFLASPEAAKVMKARGLEPGR
jgi:molybdate transport system substrate-binding protein